MSRVSTPAALENGGGGDGEVGPAGGGGARPTHNLPTWVHQDAVPGWTFGVRNWAWSQRESACY